MEKMPASNMQRPRRLLFIVLLALLPILVTPLILLFALEYAARSVLPPAIGPVLDSEPYKRLILSQAPRGITVPTRFTTNRWGMRGEDPPDNWAEWDTFILIGSSTTLCYHLDDHKTWSSLLQSKLRADKPKTWIGNAGQDGVTTASGVLFADSLLPRLRPKTLIFLTGGSDLTLSFSDERRERGSPYDHAFEKRLQKESLKTHWQEKSRIIREYHLRRRRISTEVLTLTYASHQSRFPAPLQKPEDALPPDKVVLASLSDFKGNILRIHSQAKKFGIRTVFLTQPYLYGTDSSWSQREARSIEFQGKEFRISAATERRLLNVFNDALLSLCVDRSLECMDLARHIPSDTLHFYDEGHFTEKGAALAAEKIAEYFLGTPKTL